MGNFTFQTIIENNKSFSYFLIFMGGFFILLLFVWIFFKIEKLEKEIVLFGTDVGVLVLSVFPLLCLVVYSVLVGEFLYNFMDSCFTVVDNFQKQKEHLRLFYILKIATMQVNLISFTVVFLFYIENRQNFGSSRKSNLFFLECIIGIMLFSLILGYIFLFVERYSN
ncbi:hypothetical protein CAPN002_00200 [Capnocytophaga stomatis]|uniref:hypothetical protein n=1 Tax=Capnocytophaga stomatis TaxID=1848904 RepID=UPI0019511174|nr:hypothetical protein [Capnocytophaga stomatis]GIJ92802.1 hypothetical protein CAPN002_00200 [Capnocytophaga stomatis]